MADLPTSRTWRSLLAAEAALEHALSVAGEDGIERLVGPQIMQGRRSVAAALATLEDRGAEDRDLMAVTTLTLDETDALIAVLTGAVQRTPAEAVVIVERLNHLRDRFIALDAEIRARLGIPL